MDAVKIAANELRHPQILNLTFGCGVKPTSGHVLLELHFAMHDWAVHH